MKNIFALILFAVLMALTIADYDSFQNEDNSESVYAFEDSTYQGGHYRRGKSNDGSRTYTVKDGDTCCSISRELGVNFQDLVNFNPNCGPSLMPGDVLNLSRSRRAVSLESGEDESYYKINRHNRHRRGGTYTVMDGDTCWSISRQLGISFDGLVQANANCGPRLMPGDVLTLP